MASVTQNPNIIIILLEVKEFTTFLNAYTF
jgi:hypothetical protein